MPERRRNGNILRSLTQDILVEFGSEGFQLPVTQYKEKVNDTSFNHWQARTPQGIVLRRK